MTIRHKHNAAITPWLRALASRGGKLLINVHEQDRLGLYWLGAVWAAERGLITRHDTVDVLSHEPRRFSYTLTERGKRAAQWLK